MGRDPFIGELAHGVTELSLLVVQGKGAHRTILAEVIGDSGRPSSGRRQVLEEQPGQLLGGGPSGIQWLTPSSTTNR
jgi:hypothetical protein